MKMTIFECFRNFSHVAAIVAIDRKIRKKNSATTLDIEDRNQIAANRKSLTVVKAPQ